jgi:hypothetical protein
VTFGDSVTYSLASLSPQTDFGRIGNDAIAATPAIPYAEQERSAAPITPSAVAPSAAPDRPAVAAAPLPREKPKRPAPQESGLLDDTHIAGIKTRLQLTPDQVEYWPAVEAALRDIGKSQFRNQHITCARRQGENRRQRPGSAEADLGGDAAARAPARGSEARSS